MIDGQKTVIETRVKQIISEETGELRKEMQRERVEQVSDGKVFLMAISRPLYFDLFNVL